MAVFIRLSRNKLWSHLMNVERNGILQSSRTVSLKPFPTKPAVTADYDEYNMKLGRPQSPHLTIYKPQLTSTLSITHRMTGGVLAFYSTTIAISSLILPQSLNHYVDTLNSMDVPSPVLLGAKFVLAFPLCYHTCNGTRHLLWDLGLFLTIKEVYATGYVVILAAAASIAGVLSL